MTPAQTKGLQLNLGIVCDGIFGRDTLRALFSRAGAPVGIASEFALSGIIHMAATGILDTPLRLAHFVAQIGHESDGFKAMEEYATGSAYEGRADLGNTQPGDGRRYKGKGPLQITGRANYRYYGRKAGIDFENHPELPAIPSIGLLIACLYWTDRGLNELADRDDVEAITKRVNGGLNGLADRVLRLNRMKGVIGL